MAQSKRERQRLKRAQKKKEKARRQSQVLQATARHRHAFEAAYAAEACLQRADFDGAVTLAAKAAALAPTHVAIAALYVEAADRSRILEHRARALQHHADLVDPDPRTLITLAHLHHSTGDPTRAAETAARARASFPRRLKDRRKWLAFLERIEQSVAAARPAPAAPAASPSLFPDSPADAASHTAETAAEPEPEGEADRTAGAAETPAAGSAEAPVEPARLHIPVAVALVLDGIDALRGPNGATLEDVRLSVLAAAIRDAESFDRLLAVEAATGLIRFSHQEETARKVLSVLLGRALLADEVGLGKTIEAGLVLSELLLRGRIARALILTPPSLVSQWKEELSTKFHVETRATDDAAFRSDAESSWTANGVVIASLPTARSPRNRDLVAAQPWDLIVVDEAHALKNTRTQSHALVSRLTSRFLLLLTATPIENDVEELHNLVSLIRPGLLGGRADFRRRFGGGGRRTSEAARREVRGLLSEVMIRNTRALSGVRLPPRFARTVLVEPSAEEGRLYELLVDALRALGPSGRTRLLLSLLLQEAGSSPGALRATLEKIGTNGQMEADTRAALEPAMAFAAGAPETGKGAWLLRVLRDGGATVVFTRFRATLDYLATLLGAHGTPYERIDGDIPLAARAQAIARCRESGGLLLSTDVGSEGLNLQFCRRVVNFDLPWSPMRIEQRIGRVHRIGQDHAVEIVNLCLAGSIEEKILGILDERINLFELVVGEVETILGYLEDEREFPELVFDTFADADAARRESGFRRIGDALAAARDRYRNVKSFDEAFFRNELGV